MAREYEVKLLAEGASFATVAQFLRDQLLSVCTSFQEGSSIDAYWRAVPHATGSFLRLRVSDEVVLTSKVNDTNSIEDRAEYNVPISPASKDDAMEALVATLGDPSTIMWKYLDFKVGPGVTISIIQNLEKPEYTFVEVEALVQTDVAFWVKRLKDASQYPLKQVRNSFFDIFVLRQGVLL